MAIEDENCVFDIPIATMAMELEYVLIPSSGVPPLVTFLPSTPLIA